MLIPRRQERLNLQAVFRSHATIRSRIHIKQSLPFSKEIAGRKKFKHASLPDNFFGSPLILTCAYNEEKWIGRTLEQVQEKLPFHADIVVVDDGSTDKTAEIALQKKAEVFTIPNNQGKSHAFFWALGKILDRRPMVLLTIDADLLAISSGDFKRISEQPAQATLFQHQPFMGVQVAWEGKHGNVESVVHSGFRCFSFQAQQILGRISPEIWPRGFALESFLNRLFPKTATKFDTQSDVHLRRAFEGMQTQNRQREDIEYFLASSRHIDWEGLWRSLNNDEKGNGFTSQ